jgi:hypothetical protein
MLVVFNTKVSTESSFSQLTYYTNFSNNTIKLNIIYDNILIKIILEVIVCQLILLGHQQYIRIII